MLPSLYLDVKTDWKNRLLCTRTSFGTKLELLKISPGNKRFISILNKEILEFYLEEKEKNTFFLIKNII